MRAQSRLDKWLPPLQMLAMMISFAQSGEQVRRSWCARHQQQRRRRQCWAARKVYQVTKRVVWVGSRDGERDCG